MQWTPRYTSIESTCLKPVFTLNEIMISLFVRLLELLGHSPSVSHRMALLVVLCLEAAAPFWTLAPLCWALLARPDVSRWQRSFKRSSEM